MDNDDTYSLYNYLPEAISDEAASHLVDCFHGLAYMMDSFYYHQVRRYNQAIDRAGARQSQSTNNGLYIPQSSKKRNITYKWL